MQWVNFTSIEEGAKRLLCNTHDTIRYYNTQTTIRYQAWVDVTGQREKWVVWAGGIHRKWMPQKVDATF